MIDASNQVTESIKVRTDQPEGPYLRVAARQVPQLQVLFDSIRLPYTIVEGKEAEKIAETNAQAALTTITFGTDVSPEEVQALLDGLD